MMKSLALVLGLVLMCQYAAAQSDVKVIADVPVGQMPSDPDSADVGVGVGDKTMGMSKIDEMKQKLAEMRNEITGLSEELGALTKHHASKGHQVRGIPTQGDVLLSASSSGYGSDTAYLPRNFQVGGEFIRKIARFQGLYQHDGRQHGQLSGRRLFINKLRSDTALKVTWTDNFRIYISGGWCHWEVLFNHRGCPGTRLLYAKYTAGAYYTNHHEPGTLTGVCKGLPAGRTEVTTSVYRYGGYCWTGWYTLSHLEVEEVFTDSMPR